MTPLRHILHRGLHKYGSTLTGVPGSDTQPSAAGLSGPAALSGGLGGGKMPAPATMAPSLGGNSGPQLGDTAAVSRHAFRRGFSGRAEGMPSLVTGQTYNSPAELMAAKEEIPDFDVMNTPWAPKLSDDPHVAMQQGQREYLREYGYRTGQSQRPADQQKWVDSWIANKGQMPAQRGGFPDGGPPQTPADALPTTAGPAGAQPAPNTGSILPDNFAGTVGANQPMPVAQPAPAQTAETAGQAGAQMDQQRLNQTIDQEKATNPTGGPTQPELDQAQLSERLNDQNRPVPERQQDARAYVQSLVDSDPELKQGLNDLAGGKDTPNARAFQSRIDGAGNNFVSQEFQRMMAERQAQTGAPPTTQEQGGFFQQAMDGWNNMSMPMKMMMGLGLGAGVVGLMSSLFGEGGGGMGLLGLLGLGVAGVGGAMGGMFGEGAQSGVNNMLLDAGQAMGMVPGKQDLSTLMADNPVAAAANQGGGGGLMGAVMGGTAGAKAQLAKAEQQRGQLQQLAGLPASLRNSLLMRMDPNNIKSPADAERAFANSQQILGAFDDPNSDIGKQLAAGRAYTDGGKTWYGRAGQAVDAIGQAGSAMGAFASDPMGYANQAGQATRAAISDWWTGGQEKQNSFHQHEHIVRYLVAQWADETTTKRAFNAMDAKELHDLQTLQAQKPTYDLKNTRRLHELQKRKMSQPPSNQREKIIVLCQKAARCWAGYEPVPGKAPYSNDSCRPAGSKKKPETKKKSAK